MNRFRRWHPALTPVLGCVSCFALIAQRPAQAGPPGGPAATQAAAIRKFEVTTDHVLDVAFLPDGRRFLFCTGIPGNEGQATDHAVHLWDLDTGKEIFHLAGHQKDVDCLAVAPDGRIAASGSRDGTVRLWDLTTAREIEAQRHTRALPQDLVFTPDGHRLLVGTWDRNPIEEWDVAGRKVVKRFGQGTNPVNEVAFTPDGRRALTAHNDKLLRLWDLDTGQELRRFEGHENEVKCLVLTPDGRRALSGSRDGTIRLWDIETGKLLVEFKERTRGVNGLSISPDGRRVLSGDRGGAVRLWDAETGAVLAKYDGHTDSVHAVAFAPEGRRALSAGADGTVRLWDLNPASAPALVAKAEVRVEVKPEAPAPARSVGSSLPAQPGEIRRFAASSDEVLDIAFLPDGRRFLFGTGHPDPNARATDHALHLWDLATGKEIFRLAGHEKSVRCLAVAPDGRTAASGGLDNSVRFWDLETGQEIENQRHVRYGTHEVVFAPGGRQLLSGSWDQNPIEIWDVVGRKPLKQFGRGFGPVQCVVSTPDGRRALTGHNDKLLRLWDLETEKEVRRFEGHEAPVYSVALTPDGRRVVSWSGDGTIRLWDIETGKQQSAVAMHSRTINGLAIAPGGRRVLACCADNTLRLFDLASGETLATFEGHTAAVHAAAISPDGRRALSAGGDGTVRLWDLTHTDDAGPRTIAVLDFANLGPAVELGVLRKALAEMLIGDLAKNPGLRVVERDRVEHVLNETQMGRGGLVDAASAQRAGNELAADYLVTGSIAGSESQITIAAALTRTGAAEPRGRWSIVGPSERLFALERDLAAKIRAALGVDEPRGNEPPTVAVLGFRDLSPKPRLKEMESGFSEVLQAELSSLEGLRLVERAKLDAVLREQKLALSGLVATESAVKVGRLLGANRLIVGSFIELGTNLRVETRVVETETAAVIAAETAEGPTEQFAALFEDLARRLVSSLSGRSPAQAAIRRRDASPTRKLEAARHYALGREALRQDRYAEAAAALERALLLEPDNLSAHYYRVLARFNSGDYPRTIEAALLALSRPFTPKDRWTRSQITSYLGHSYSFSGRYQEHLAFAEKMIAEDPQGEWVGEWRTQMVTDLVSLGKNREAVDLLNKNLTEAKASGDASRNAQALRENFQAIQRNWRNRTQRDDILIQVELLDRLLKDAEAHQTKEWDAWALQFPHAITREYIYIEGGERKSALTDEKRIDYLRRTIARFSHLAGVQWTCQLCLAWLLDSTGQWNDARSAYRYVVEHSGDTEPDRVPWRMEFNHYGRDDVFNTVLRSRVRAAYMLGSELADKPGATSELKAILHDYGLAHQTGAFLAVALKELGQPIELPAKGALIVGGGDNAWKGWSRILEPFGYAVHPYDLELLTAANLAPYSLVVLARQGGRAFQPSEILAFRSYVATGGALLVVVSPGWSSAAPGVVKPLLSFFGVQVRSDVLPTRVRGALDGAHPISQGLNVKEMMAKDAVALDAPAETVVAGSKVGKLLVALPYREGRVVVAALGQWLTPDIQHLGKRWWNHAFGMETKSRIDEAPIETGDGVQLPLLRNVIGWLAEPVPGRPAGRHLPDDFRTAHQAALEVLYRVRPRGELPQVLETFVAAAGARREEALWLAGEAMKPLQWFDNHSTAMTYGWPLEVGPPTLDPRYFDMLTRSYPTSALAPYARWEIAELDRLNRVYDRNRLQSNWVDIPIDAARVIPAFQKVDTPKGNYAWAWAQLRLALLNLQADHPEQALEHARAVADVMEPGPEKTLALFHAAVAFERQGKAVQAKQYYDIIRDSPECLFPDDSEGSAWAPVYRREGVRRPFFMNGPSRLIAERWSQRLENKK